MGVQTYRYQSYMKYSIYITSSAVSASDIKYVVNMLQQYKNPSQWQSLVFVHEGHLLMFYVSSDKPTSRWISGGPGDTYIVIHRPSDRIITKTVELCGSVNIRSFGFLYYPSTINGVVDNITFTLSNTESSTVTLTLHESIETLTIMQYGRVVHIIGNDINSVYTPMGPSVTLRMSNGIIVDGVR